MSTDQLGAGTVFEVKYLFAIDSIAAVYRGRSKLNKTREHTSVSILSRYEPTAEAPARRTALGYRVDCELIFSFPIEPDRCSLLSC
jgi:hypothetical protein